MGGHGAWHIATHFPDIAIAVSTAAGSLFYFSLVIIVASLFQELSLFSSFFLFLLSLLFYFSENYLFFSLFFFSCYHCCFTSVRILTHFPSDIAIADAITDAL